MANTKKQQMAAIASKQDITVELATRPAHRLWQGREKTAKKYGILGLPGFCKLMRGMEQAIRNDDPYADRSFHVIDQAVEDLSFDLESELKDIETYITEHVPPAMQLPDVASKNPVVVPVRFASRVGFKMVYQILKVDQIVLKVLLANHIGILPNKEKFETLARVERKVRAVIHLVFNYRHTGVTRDDMAANNSRAQQAKELMGELEQGYLEGTTRSENAPALPFKRLNTLNQSANPSSTGTKTEPGKADDALEAELDKVLQEAEIEGQAEAVA